MTNENNKQPISCGDPEKDARINAWRASRKAWRDSLPDNATEEEQMEACKRHMARITGYTK